MFASGALIYATLLAPRRVAFVPMSSRVDFTRILGATVLLGTCFLAEARGHAPDVSAHGSKMPASSHGTAVLSSPDAVTTELPSYFGSSADARLIYAHITFMILAWIVVLPLGRCPASSDREVATTEMVPRSCAQHRTILFGPCGARDLRRHECARSPYGEDVQ